MLLPSAIQRSEDLVGIATPTVPLSPEAPEFPPPQAARLMARAAPATVAINLRTTFSTLLRAPGAVPVACVSWSAQASESLRESVVRLVPPQLLAQAVDLRAAVD